MNYQLSNFTDRESEYPNRRKLIDIVTGEEKTYDVQRAEGVISQEGTTWNAQTMNNFDQKIANAFEFQEGAFTPYINVDGVTKRRGHYYKIGKLCYITVYFYGATSSHQNDQLYFTLPPGINGYFDGDYTVSNGNTDSMNNYLLCGKYIGTEHKGVKYGVVLPGEQYVKMFVYDGAVYNGENIQADRDPLLFDKGNIFELSLSGVYRTN